MKNLLLSIVIFFAVGEGLVRFDRAMGFFEGQRTVALANSTRPTEELTDLEQGRFKPQQNETRILLLGDSALHGGGLPNNEIFAERIKALASYEKLAAEHPLRVLD